MTSRIEIDGIDEVLPGVPGLAVLPAVPAKPDRTWLPWVALVALAAGVGVWEARRPPTLPENPLANAQFTPFTDWEGTEGWRRNLAGWEVRGLHRRSRWRVRPLGEPGGHRTFRKPHSGHPAAGWLDVLRTLGFSGDGAAIWFTRPEPEGAKVAHAPDRRHATAFLGTAAAPAPWSPDGRRLVYFNGTGSVTDFTML